MDSKDEVMNWWLVINGQGEQLLSLPIIGMKILSICSYFFVNLIDDEEPSCYDEAKGTKEWKCAMDEEINALMKNKT